MATSEEIIDLSDQGLSVREIADRLGVSKSTVYSRLQSAGPPPKPQCNPARSHLTQDVYDLMVKHQIPRLTAARRVIETAKESTLLCASNSKRPVTPRRLAEWSKP